MRHRLTMRLKKAIRRIVDRVVYLFLGDVKQQLAILTAAVSDQYVRNEIDANPKYQHPGNLMKHGYRVCSQHDEDGIIQEIFNRIGTTNRQFVEFGVGDGSENNTLYLLLKDWRGYWLDCNHDAIEEIRLNYRELVDSKKLKLSEALITAENIEDLFAQLGVPTEFDLLSVDIDGNDYWVWKSITSYRPRVVVIEYNAAFRETDRWVMAYNPEHRYDFTSYAGASLKSMESLADSKGYRLVGCNFSGTNAFFVREDLIGDKFMEPYTAENHYEPIRYYVPLGGNFKRVGAFETI